MTEAVELTVFGHGPSDNMRVLGKGELPLPGACVSCGSGNCDDGYLFLGIHIDFHGALMLCNDCVIHGGEKMGMLAPSIADKLHLQDVQLAEECAKLRRENEALRDRLTVFNDAIRDLVPDPIISLTDGDDSAGEEQSSSEPVIEDASSTVDETESVITESVEDSGSSEPVADATSNVASRRRGTKRSIKL